MLSWNESMSTGSPLIDTQHRILIEKISSLEGFLGATEVRKEDVDALLSFLEGYVVNHFKFEEQCMLNYRCPAHAANKMAHQQFLAMFGRFKERYATEGPTQAFLSELHRMTGDWIRGHIMKVDVQLKPCMQK